MDRVADVLKTFYLGQHPTPEIEQWGRIQRVRISTDENFRQVKAYVGHTLSASNFEALQSYTRTFFRAHGALFESRVRERWIRDCHGDLHLEHIHVTPRQVQIYDCIEFNDRFRYVDVANDIAFLAMDLEYKGRADLAVRLVKRLARGLGDSQMLGLMDFYKCYRAIVRGKVETLHSLAETAPEVERRESAERARRYFQLALGYALGGARSPVVVVMGRIGSGKSTLAKAISEETGWEVVSSDRVRKQSAGYPLYERSDAAARRRLYSKKRTELTYRSLFRAARQAWSEGRGIVIDATFAQRRLRDQWRAWCEAKGMEVRFVEVSANDRVIRDRLRQREMRAGEVSDARLEDFEAFKARYEPPTELPRECLVHLRRVDSADEVMGRLLDVFAKGAARRGT
jgi:hypothetical protein